MILQPNPTRLSFARIVGQLTHNFESGLIMFKTLGLAAAFTLGFALPAFAGQCQDDIAKIDAALEVATLDADQKTEVTDLREQAVQLCGAGNEQEGLDVTAQAMALLSIE
jgi:hypothetical protein